MRVCLLMLNCLLLVACMNTNTVNIIMTNTDDRELSDRQVTISLTEVCAKMQIDTLKTFILLNEKNLPVDYRLAPDNKSISFPVSVRGKSQKTYSIHQKAPCLSDNFMKFRCSNIYLTVK